MTNPVRYRALVNANNEVENPPYWCTEDVCCWHSGMSDEDLLEAANDNLQHGPYRIAILVELPLS